MQFYCISSFLIVLYCIILYCIFVTYLIVGFAAFGSDVNGEVLVSLTSVLPKAAMHVISCFVIIKVGTEAAIFNQAAFTLLRDIIGLTIEADHIDYRPRNKYIDYIMRVVWVIIGTLIAMYIPVVSFLYHFRRKGRIELM
jgi:hypothetical protein